jgi:methionyl-tRNA synthetase
VNFSWSGLAERVNGELVGTLGNFCYRSLLFAERNYGGTPDAGVSDEVGDRIEAAMAEFRTAIDDYRVRGLGRAPVELAKFGNEYIQGHEPWKLTDSDPEKAARVIRDCVQLSKAIAVLMEPVLPGKAEELWAQLGEDGSVHDVALEAALASPPAEFGDPEELFEGIEDDRVAELERQLEERVEAAEGGSDDAGDDEGDGGDRGTDAEAGGASDLEPLLEERVSFEAFQGLDLRVGEILEAEPIEGADKLAKLRVDIGVETRQIVAGIKQLYDLEELPGTRIVVVANLERSELFGVESNGMLLAAGEEADLLTTHGDAEPGTRIR